MPQDELVAGSLCWAMWYWMNWIGNWTGVATVSPDMR